MIGGIEDWFSVLQSVYKMLVLILGSKILHVDICGLLVY